MRIQQNHRILWMVDGQELNLVFVLEILRQCVWDPLRI